MVRAYVESDLYSPSNGLIINETDEQGETALHVASRSHITAKMLGIFMYLLECPKYALVNKKNNGGNTVLHTTVSMFLHTHEMVKLLLESPRFTGVNEKNHNGDTALHRASFGRRLGVVPVFFKSSIFNGYFSKTALKMAI